MPRYTDDHWAGLRETYLQAATELVAEAGWQAGGIRSVGQRVGKTGTAINRVFSEGSLRRALVNRAFAASRGNKQLACDWWQRVDYESLIGLDPRELCFGGGPAATSAAAPEDAMLEAKNSAFEDLLRIMTDEIVALMDMKADDPMRAAQIDALAKTCTLLTTAEYLRQTMVGLARLCEGQYHGFKGETAVSCRSYRLSREALATLGDPLPGATVFAKHILSARKILDHYLTTDCR
ncbi:hypothetical protein [Sphingomonas sp. M1-B02]|uniref:hypothetical protein n=1 Tax=Sphingomonas sp. M1-B02 TaxID=3114300 RepID=UPI00224068CF|nr:hypothetical protein [Sphingomonas sp. S6-11]UZK64639.1 hypothetical protein OKW87_08745 [Sphingomonas sp. S6-11]